MIQLINEPIEIANIRKMVLSQESGAMVVFEGTVRNHQQGKKVVALQYEAYPRMALSVLKNIAEQAKTKWSLNKAAIVHRYGLLKVEETAVVVAVSCAHRKEAFNACSEIMERIKKEAPIWKKEFYDDGESEWVFCQAHSLPAEPAAGLEALKH